MLYAVKGNKQLKIEETQQDGYLKLGYDIAEFDGEHLKTIATAPSNTVSRRKYDELLKQNETLKEQLLGSGQAEAIEGLRAQVDLLQKENEELKKQVEAKQATAKKQGG